MAVQEDGSLLLTILACHEVAIAIEFMKHCARVEVLEPVLLRQKAIAEIKTLISDVGR